MIDPKSSVPLYLQIATMIGNDIISGKLRRGDQLPSEPALSSQFGVSRVTVRRAIAELVERGFLLSKQGKGTYVSTSDFFANASALQQSFTLSSMGMSRLPTTRVLSQCVRCPRAEEAALAEIPMDQEIICVERLRFVNEKPALLEYDYFTKDFGDILSFDLENRSLIAVLGEHFGRRPVQFDDQFRIVLATEEQAKHLEIQAGTPLLGVFERVLDEAGAVIYTNDELILPEVYTYRIRYKT